MAARAGLYLMSVKLAGDAAFLALLEPLAIAAGEAILDVRAHGVTTNTKADLSPVTEADNRAEAIILKGLAAHFPQVPVVAEEETAAGRMPDIAGQPFFLVDPLDGTKEFISGKSDFTVNIALIENGVPVAGIVYAPARGVIYAGGLDGAERADVLPDGLIVNRRKIKGAAVGDAVRIVASKSHNTPETDAFVSRFENAQCVSIGSSLKFCLLAEGAADLYPRFGRTMEWDTAAGDAVLRAAGGITRRVDGSPLLYGKREQTGDCDFANPHFIAVTKQGLAQM